MPPLIAQHKIFPVKGREARDYLLRQGCLLSSEMITLPNHLKMVPLSGSGITYAVMQNQEEVFRMQYDSSTNTWRVVVPLRYQVTFLELGRSYGTKTLWAAGVFGNSETMLQLIEELPIRHPVAVAVLERLSRYTGHPYDLENVKIALTQETRDEEKERETNLVGN